MKKLNNYGRAELRVWMAAVMNTDDYNKQKFDDWVVLAERAASINCNLEMYGIFTNSGQPLWFEIKPEMLEFDPARTFDSTQEAIDLIMTQVDPLDALKAVVNANIHYSEFGFCAELLLHYSRLEC